MVHSCCSVSFPTFLRQRIHCIYKLHIVGLFPSFGCHSVGASLEVELAFGSWGCIFLNRGIAVPGHMAILCLVFGGATLLFSTTSLFMFYILAETYFHLKKKKNRLRAEDMVECLLH